MANLSNINNKFIVTDGGNGRVLIGATNDIGATLFANHPSTTAPSLTFNAPAGQVFENEDLQIAFGLNNASPYNAYMQNRFVSAPFHRNLAINPLGGDVGIGTNSPGEKLEVKGNIVINSQSTSSATTELDQLIFRKLHPNGAGSGFYNQASIRSKTFGGYSGGLNFYTNKNLGAGSYGERLAMSIDNDQNVGIGTDSPGAKLDISNVAGGTYALEISTPERDRALFFYNSASVSDAGYLGIKRGSVDALNHRFATSGNSAVCIGTGNFGIGTDSPDNKLQVVAGNAQVQAWFGETTYTNAAIRIGGANDAGGRVFIQYVGDDSYIDSYGGHGSTQRYRDFTVGARNIRFVTGNTSGSEKMRVAESGKTLIGLTSEQNAGHFQMQSGASENGGILDIAGGGWYRYYTRVCRNATTAQAAGYWHIKTNIVVNSDTMFMAKFYGYIYGGAQIVELTHAGYAYSGSNTVINQATTNNGSDPNANSVIYSSSNGNKVTFRIAFGLSNNFSTYFAGVMMDIAFPNPTGQGHDFEIEAQSFSTSGSLY